MRNWKLRLSEVALICGLTFAAYLYGFGRAMTSVPSNEVERQEPTCAWDKLLASLKACENFTCIGRQLDREMTLNADKDGAAIKEPSR